MFAIIVAMAAAALPQSTTPQGNGHHASDERRETSAQPSRSSTKGAEKRKQKPAEDVREKSETPGESRESDGVLMPGAPGTNDPAIPGSTSSGG